jgi:hypothetical protein
MPASPAAAQVLSSGVPSASSSVRLRVGGWTVAHVTGAIFVGVSGGAAGGALAGGLVAACCCCCCSCCLTGLPSQARLPTLMSVGLRLRALAYAALKVDR